MKLVQPRQDPRLGVDRCRSCERAHSPMRSDRQQLQIRSGKDAIFCARSMARAPELCSLYQLPNRAASRRKDISDCSIFIRLTAHRSHIFVASRLMPACHLRASSSHAGGSRAGGSTIRAIQMLDVHSRYGWRTLIWDRIPTWSRQRFSGSSCHPAAAKAPKQASDRSAHSPPPLCSDLLEAPMIYGLLIRSRH